MLICTTASCYPQTPSPALFLSVVIALNVFSTIIHQINPSVQFKMMISNIPQATMYVVIVCCYSFSILLCFSQVASRGEDIPTVTDSSIEIITGPANRLLLTKEILDFCGSLPIYNTEHTKMDLSHGNGTASKWKFNFVNLIKILFQYISNTLQST